MRTKIADLEFSPLDEWLSAHPGRCFKFSSFGDEVTITVWQAATSCGTATGSAVWFADLLESAIAQCERHQLEAEEGAAIREEARRRLAERDGRGAAE